MSPEGINEQIDDGIVQSNEDVLRARDIIPPFNYKGQQKAKPADEKTKKKTADNNDVIAIEPIFVEKKSAKKVVPLRPAKAAGEKVAAQTNAVPRFNLAEDIMAEQRKTMASKRGSPEKKAVVAEVQAEEVQPVGAINTGIMGLPPEADQIIAEIVARDIEKLCRTMA